LALALALALAFLQKFRASHAQRTPSHRRLSIEHRLR